MFFSGFLKPGGSLGSHSWNGPVSSLLHTTLGVSQESYDFFNRPDEGENTANDMTRRELVLIALRRGVSKRCPHCGEGPIFSGWAHQLERCAVCGLVYERNPGDTWAFAIFGDRLPLAVIIVLIYFGVGRLNPLLGSGAIVLLVALLRLDRAEPMGSRNSPALPLARLLAGTG